MCSDFWVSFSELLYFVRFFFQFTDTLFGSILPIFAYMFAVYYVYFIKMSNIIYFGGLFLILATLFFVLLFLASVAHSRHFYGELPSLPGSMHDKTSNIVM